MYDSTYIKFSKRQKCKNWEYISGRQELRISTAGREVGVTKKANMRDPVVMEVCCIFTA